MRFASLGSGSRGNATLLECEGVRILIDCGFSLRETTARLLQKGIEPESISAIFVTHEHGDHIKGVGPLARKHKIPVWMTHGTWRKGLERFGDIKQLTLFHPDENFKIDHVQVDPFSVPHDAMEPVQYAFLSKGQRFATLTDTGSITPHIIHMLKACNALLLECNHDLEMLKNGPYPPALQDRVGGDWGHLNNHQSASLLQQIDLEGMKHLVIGHLSEKNNHPDLAVAALFKVVPEMKDRIRLTSQDSVSDWYELPHLVDTNATKQSAAIDG